MSNSLDPDQVLNCFISYQQMPVVGSLNLYFLPFPVSSASLSVYVCSLVVYIANNNKLRSSLIRVHINICLHDESSLE